jgi:hypothetical protein
LQPLPVQLYSLNFTEQIAAAPLQLLNSALKLELREMPVGPEPIDLTSQLKVLYEKQPEKKELKKSLYKFLSSKNTPSRQSLSQP